jgi:hypothetical protein
MVHRSGFVLQPRMVGWLVAIAVAALNSGCGSVKTPPTAKVSGTVTYNGSPLANVTVTFQPSQGRPASGVTDSSGKFTLSTFGKNDGALPGNHRISIAPNSADVPMPETPEEAEKPPKLPFPARYTNAETSMLTAVVEKGKANNFPLQLTD